jgi:hypothetical protein
MALSEVGFLSVVCAKLRTEMVAVRRPPKFKITVTETERFVAKGATSGAAVDQIPAARDHERPPSSEDNCHIADSANH